MKAYIADYPRNPQRPRIENIQFHSYDCWNMDSLLAKLIAEAVQAFKNSKRHGCPGEFVDVGGDDDISQQLSFDFYKESYSDASKIKMQEWEDTLDQIIWAFKEYNEDWEDQFFHGRIDLYSESILNGTLYEVKPGPHHTFKIDHQGRAAHWNKMQEGFQKFIQYFPHFWD